MNAANTRQTRTREAFLSYVAIWQLAAFTLLICLVWVSEILDLPAILFGASSSGARLFRGFILTAAVLVTAVIAVGNTYLQQKHILRGILVRCTACGKVKVNRDVWEDMDQYLEAKTLATLKRDVCPGCFRSMEKEITATNVEQWKSKATPTNG